MIFFSVCDFIKGLPLTLTHFDYFHLILKKNFYIYELETFPFRKLVASDILLQKWEPN